MCFCSFDMTGHRPNAETLFYKRVDLRLKWLRHQAMFGECSIARQRISNECESPSEPVAHVGRFHCMTLYWVVWQALSPKRGALRLRYAQLQLGSFAPFAALSCACFRERCINECFWSCAQLSVAKGAKLPSCSWA